MENQPSNTRVHVVDLDMPFGSMFRFMLKWALASIPAFILLFIFSCILGLVLTIMLGGTLAGLAGMSGTKAPPVVNVSPTPKP